MSTGWIPHRRADGEVVGYARMVGELFEPLDRLGRPIAPPAEWATTEELLDAQSLAWLAEPWLLCFDDGTVRRTRVAEVSETEVVLVDDQFGSIGDDPPRRHRVPLPVPADRLLPAPPLDELPA